jgi:hypothetical protein
VARALACSGELSVRRGRNHGLTRKLSAEADSGTLKRAPLDAAARWCNPLDQPAVSLAGNRMRSLLKPGLLIELQQNKAGLIADLAILLLFLVLLAVR